MKPGKEAIVDYYDLCEGDYRTFWDLDHSLAMHAGFWDETTTNLRDALMRENEVLAERVKITSTDRVLDAGCGVGGSSIFLAMRYGCRVVGITLSQKQAERANANAVKCGVDTLVSFQVADFCKTPFEPNSFDVVWGLESICHAQEKSHFVKEVYRLLKKGGRLIVADGFATHSTYSQKEATKMKVWLRGWGVESLETLVDFKKHLQEQQFEEITFQEINENVLPSSKKLFRLSMPAYLLSKMGEWVGLRQKIQTDNIKAAYYQYTTLNKALWTYAIFTCRK